MAMNPNRIAESLPVIFWRCPACRAEDALEFTKVKTGLLSSKPVVVCRSCCCEWEDFSEISMTTVKGPSDLSGRRSLDEWYSTLGVGLHQEKTKKVRTGGGKYGGVRLPLLCTGAGAVRFHTGLFNTPARYETSSEISKVDSGELLLTNKRLVFCGSRKPVGMKLSGILALDLEKGLLRVHYGQKTYFLSFARESPLKWQAYVEEACRQCAS